MCSRTETKKFTKDCSDNILCLKAKIAQADAVLVGAGAGLSASAGLTYSGERFERYFSDFKAKYGITDMYAGGFYPFGSPEEYWAWWSRHILINRYDVEVGKPYRDLLSLVRQKDYFVLTTNVDHQFQLAGFDKERLFYTQGDYGLWQCSRPCRDQTYDNEEPVRQMAARQKNMKIPTELIPKCPVCGAPMTMNLRSDETFVEDRGWHRAAERYCAFVNSHRNSAVVLLELGVGMNTPGIIKYSFWQMAARNRKAFYACVNLDMAFAPLEIADRSVCIEEDIGKVLPELSG